VALSEDQKAMLRLLAQREEGYEDIGALMGLSVPEVRARVKDALAELDSGAGAAVDTSPPPSHHEPSPPEPEPEPKPEASPRAAPAPAATPPAVAEPAPSTERRRRPAPPKDRRRLAEIIGGAVIALLLILFATGAVDLGGDDDDSSSDGSDQAAAITPTSTSKQPTRAVLKGVDGSEAEGEAVFGRLQKQVLLVLAAKGLPPTPQGRSYAISLARSPSERIPIAATKVGKDGSISGQFQVPATALGLLAGGFDELEVSLVANDDLRVAVTEAQKEGATPSFEGIDVLRGPVTGPVVDAGEGS
jgi:hypothetical protein